MCTFCLNALISAERGDHERTKTELMEMRKQHEAWKHEDKKAQAEVIAERDAARAERDSHLQRYLKTREHLDAAQAEAAELQTELHRMQEAHAEAVALREVMRQFIDEFAIVCSSDCERCRPEGEHIESCPLGRALAALEAKDGT